MKQYIFRRGRAPARPANGTMADGTHRGASPTNKLSFHEYNTSRLLQFKSSKV